MFTGIVQAVGTIKQAGKRLVVEGKLPYEIPVGGSVSVNGCCLTHVGGELLNFDLSEETLRRTTLVSLKKNDKVNLEAALRAGDPIGGHFVQGHVDGVGTFIRSEGERFTFDAANGEELLVEKGSICIDGVSLTVMDSQGPRFSCALVPVTLARTTLSRLAPGDAVNLEYDILAKYAMGIIR